MIIRLATVELIEVWSTLLVRKSISPYPRLVIDGDGAGVVSHAGAALLLRTAEKTGLTRDLAQRLGPWRKPMAIHDPGKIVLDLAVCLAIGGDCAADLALLRAEPGVFGLVASDPTVSRTIAALAADAPKALAAIAAARAQARAQAWTLAGEHAIDHGTGIADPLVIDLDATLTDAHSEKQHAAPTFKRGFGFHPLWAFIDHGEAGTGEGRGDTATGQRGIEHRRGPQTSPERGTGATTSATTMAGREKSAGAHRFRRRNT